jgi:hypothetical protein
MNAVVTFLDPGEVIFCEGLGRTVANLSEMHDAIAALATEPSLWEATIARRWRYAERCSRLNCTHECQ